MGYYSLLNWGIHEESGYRGEIDIVAVTGSTEAAKSNRGAPEAYRIKYGNTPNKSRIYSCYRLPKLGKINPDKSLHRPQSNNSNTKGPNDPIGNKGYLYSSEIAVNFFRYSGNI